MPQSEEHILLVELFNHHPELAGWIAQLSGRVRLPFIYSARAVDPAQRTADLSADAVSLLLDEADRVELALPVEIQRAPDPVKDFSWPAYGWLERSRQRCDSRVLVLATRPEVARWARQFERGAPDEPVQILVLDPNIVPRITDPAVARAHPPRAVLSAALHAGRADGHAIMRAAVVALLALPPARAKLYSNLVFHSLPRLEIARLFREIMQAQQIPHEEEEYAAGWKEFLRDLEGRAALQARAEVLLSQLRQRGFRITAAARARILASTDTAELDLWLARVLTITRLSALFT